MHVTLLSLYPSISSFGVRTLSAYLKRTGHHVRIVFLPQDFQRKYTEKTLSEIARSLQETDLIGISLMTNFFDNAVQITQRLKSTGSAPILWGGIHPTIRPEECLEHADMVCIGEGEESLAELAGKMEAGLDHRHVPGMWVKHNNRITKNSQRPLIQDLDAIPSPDYDLENHYILEDEHVVKMTMDLFQEHCGGKYMTFPTRGCPFGCTYCCNNTLNKIHAGQKIVRKRSIDSLITELMHVKAHMPSIQSIYFDDDAFFLYSTENIKEFSSRYKQDIALPLIITGATPSTLNKEKLSLLVDAGLTFVRMGIQTGSERTRKLYGRHYTDQQVIEAAQIIHGFIDRIRPPLYDIIIDNPWETEEDLISTLVFLTKLPPPYALSIFSLTFYPGTALYDKARQYGLIVDDIKDVYRKYYHCYNRSFLNKLFFLLDVAQGRISTNLMSLLTNRKMRAINYLLYYALLVLRGSQYLLREGYKDIQKRDLSRIKRFTKIAASAVRVSILGAR